MSKYSLTQANHITEPDINNYYLKSNTYKLFDSHNFYSLKGYSNHLPLPERVQIEVLNDCLLFFDTEYPKKGYTDDIDSLASVFANILNDKKIMRYKTTHDHISTLFPLFTKDNAIKYGYAKDTGSGYTFSFLGSFWINDAKCFIEWMEKKLNTGRGAAPFLFQK